MNGRNHRSHGTPFAGSVPMLGQQMSREDAAKAEIGRTIQSLSLSIYSKMVTDHIAHRDVHQDVDREVLKRMAVNSRVAAQAYFEGLGIISAESPEPEQGA